MFQECWFPVCVCVWALNVLKQAVILPTVSVKISNFHSFFLIDLKIYIYKAP